MLPGTLGVLLVLSRGSCGAGLAVSLCVVPVLQGRRSSTWRRTRWP